MLAWIDKFEAKFLFVAVTFSFKHKPKNESGSVVGLANYSSNKFAMLSFSRNFGLSESSN